MGRFLSWLGRSRSARDFLEGAAMVLPSEPPSSSRVLYNADDVFACISDMHAVGRDLRRVMDHVDRDVVGKR